jgi:CDGSH-type Zn-finger protein
LSSSTEDTAAAPVVVTVTADGPYVVSGPVEIRTADGRLAKAVNKAALCRCGHSENKPFCDGSHRRVGFTDPGPAAAEG